MPYSAKTAVANIKAKGGATALPAVPQSRAQQTVAIAGERLLHSPNAIPKRRPGRQKGIVQRPLSTDQWRMARAQFESGGPDMSCARIAAIFQTSLSSVQKRCAGEKWRKGLEIVESAKRELHAATTIAMQKAAQDVAQKLARDLTAELQPWIEKEKREQIKRAVKRSKRAFKRLDKVSAGYSVYDAKRGELVECAVTPKDEMALATSEEKYDSIIRRNLGMSEETPTPGRISLRMLAGPVAIEVSASG